jgi:putative tryptophan/tyrosine transport system substrate-binding protein
MRRREFIALVGSAAATWPLAARAEQPKVPVIGFLSSGSEQAFAPMTAGFVQGLRETGFVEGHNVAIEYRWTAGRYDRLADLASELVRSQVAVLIASGGTVVARAAKAATTTIPIIFSTADDPVANGLVTSLNRPAENVTGIALLSTELAAKRLGLVRELIPGARSVAVLINAANPESETIIKDAQEAADVVGTKMLVLNAGTEAEIDAAFATLVRENVGALIVGTEPFFFIQRNQLIASAARFRVPTVYFLRDFAVAGGLMSYGTSFPDAYRQVGLYAGRILNGEKAADLPVLQPTKFEFLLNLKTAKALGLTIPSGVLAIADEVIE